MTKHAQPFEQFSPASLATADSRGLSTQAWESMPRASRTASAELPKTLNFNADIYPQRADSPALSASEIKPALDKASSINFTSPAENAKSGQQPDFILGEDGKLRANPDKKTPNKDGSINIEIQSKNKSETDSKKLADQLQKSAVKDLINYFKNSHPPGTKLPQDWLDQLSKEPELPPPVTPLETPPPAQEQPQSPPENLPRSQQPQQQPTDQGASSGTSSGGGSSSGGSGRGDAGSGGSSGGGSGGGRGDGGGTSGGGQTTYDGGISNASPQTVLTNAAIVAEVAQKYGIDPKLAIADMLVESGGDNMNKTGDGGHSVGLFQLNDAGGLGSGMSIAERQDPRKNAEVALSHWAEVQKATGASGAELAYQGEKPADHASYLTAVNGQMGQAEQILAQIQQQGGPQAVIAANEKGNSAPGGNPGGTQPIEANGLAFPVVGYDKSTVNPHWGDPQVTGGTDIFAPQGTPVVALEGGTVISAGYSSIGGNNVEIRQKDGLVAYYAHMVNAPLVKEGQTVATGQQIGQVGDTGDAKGTGYHLHFGLGNDIKNGSDKLGGTGIDSSGRPYNAVAVLDQVLEQGKKSKTG